ncbi:hypothetical protein CEP54_012462 [Fusarium duplospermum]|uniref:WW domain-containing protein n=1 Tax=Fusarium duplospermum TaxID=1325734 RepID=A0A428P8T1_9HYPO|nr:hypothetical protein CEP54_012462 [Fusarium duplospermum]
MSYLGNLVGDQWSQYSNHAGQIYYVEIATGESQYSIPTGWEDDLQDSWNHDVTCQHWMNTRTGRIIFQDPNPPPARTYLDRRSVAAHMQTVERNPASSEATYRRATTAILKCLFKEEEGYDVVQEDDRGTSVPDHVVFKVECRAGGSLYTYDFMMVEVKKAGESWDSAFEQCTRHCENSHNESGQVCAMVQVGMEIQFHQWGDTMLTPLTNTFHLRQDVQTIMEWANYLKAHPLPFVKQSYQ